MNYTFSFKKLFIFLFCLFVGLLGTLCIFVAISNPYNQFSLVQTPYSAQVVDGQVQLQKTGDVTLLSSPILTPLAYFASGFHILTSRYFGSKPIQSTSVDEIIQNIHVIRFDPTKPYLISGDQFSVYYPRNLGVFYASLLDPRIGFTEDDWENREKIYIQSVAYALDVYSQYKDTTTTLVPFGTTHVLPLNIYAYPSDTLFSLLYALKAMQTSDEITNRFPITIDQPFTLQTANASGALLHTYGSSLKQLLLTYSNTVYDSNTGLLKKGMQLSSARDSVVRQSSFYDNVIYWKTLSLANDLGVLHTSPAFLSSLRERILQTFWYANGGYFLDDLSPASMQNKSYSSDWLIAVNTGFLDPNNKTDQKYLVSIISYIQANNIDQPFPIKYRVSQAGQKEFSFVSLFVPNYGEDAIWSPWGIDYIKTLILLYSATNNQSYLQTATKDMAIYKSNILKYGGFPETYDNQGNLLENAFYKSILINGWVINYEEAEGMLQTVTNK